MKSFSKEKIYHAIKQQEWKIKELNLNQDPLINHLKSMDIMELFKSTLLLKK